MNELPPNARQFLAPKCEHRDDVRVVRAKDVDGDCNVRFCLGCGALIVHHDGHDAIYCPSSYFKPEAV